MKNYCFTLILIGFSFIGCVKKYKRNAKVCDGKLFVEIFNVNPAGVDSHYLTDSLNFRVYIGKFDNEHENFHYFCRGDSIIIEKLSTNDASGIRKATPFRKYNLEDLKKRKDFK
jgi:glycine/serine hydroxymethyltransferase